MACNFEVVSHPSQENIILEREILGENSLAHNVGWYSVFSKQEVELGRVQKCINRLFEEIDVFKMRVKDGVTGTVPLVVLDGQETRVPVVRMIDLIHDFGSDDESTGSSASVSVSSRNSAEEFTGTGSIKQAVEWMQKQVNQVLIDIHDPASAHFVVIHLKDCEKYILFTNIHHVYIDGFGCFLLHEQFHKMYNGTRELNFPSFVGYAKQRAGQDLSKEKRYWTKFVQDVVPTKLPERYDVETGSWETHVVIPKRIADKLRSFANHVNHQVLAALMAIVGVYLEKSLQLDEGTVVGTTVHGRSKDTMDLVGMCANSIFAHMGSNHVSFLDAFHEMAQSLKDGFANRAFPTRQIAKLADGKKLSEVMVLYDAFHGSCCDHGFIGTQHGSDALLLRFADYGMKQGSILLTLMGFKSCFRSHELHLIGERLSQMIAVLMDSPNMVLDDLEIAVPSEIETLLEWGFSNCEFPYDGERDSLAVLFERQVSAHEHDIALVHDQTQLTYGALNRLANQYAHGILESSEQIGSADIVAIYMHQGIHFIASILGCIKAGKAYLPISPMYKKESECSFMFKDAKVAIILTDDRARATRALPEADGFKVITYEQDLANQTTTNPRLGQPIDMSAIAYVMFTSGSTGMPKAVLIEQNNIASLALAKDYINISSQDVLVQLSNPTFDAATFEIWGALLNGAKLVFPRDTTSTDFTVETMEDLLQTNKVTILWLTKTLFDMLFREQPRLFRSLKYLLSGGEALSPRTVHDLLNHPERPRHFLNAYGPTETCTFATTFACDEFAFGNIGVPIGRPIAGRSCFVLTSQMKFAPIGTIGELYIGGEGVGRGYLNRSDLTNERFIQHDEFGKLYKTGDCVRWMPNGYIQFVGRNDNQIKIRGFRVELDGIASLIETSPLVKQAVVVDHCEGTTRYLVAYVVFHERDSDMDLVRQFLATQVPDYCVPSCFMEVYDALSINANGKLDRKSLPTPVLTKDASASDFVAPRNELETELCKMWAQILNIVDTPIGIKDNWFRLGGDSIISIQLVHRLRQTGFQNIRSKDIFEAGTVEKMAQRIMMLQGTESKGSGETAEQGMLDETPFPLLPIQSWFFQQDFPQPSWFNQAFIMQLPAACGEKKSILENALLKVVTHHDSLRLVFVPDENGNVAKQRYVDTVMVKVMDQTTEAMGPEQLTELQRATNFDLFKGPLFRFALLEGDRLWLCFHHLIIDSVSWRIIADDILRVLENPAALEMEPKTSSYRQWVDMISSNVDKINESQGSHWEQIVETVCASPWTMALRDSVEAETFHVRLSKDLTQSLVKASHYAFNTEMNDLLLSALVIALREGNLPDGSIALEGIGRSFAGSSLDTSRTVGWFTTMYPVAFTTGSNVEDLADIIVSTKEALRQVPDKGIGYGALWQSERVPHVLPMVSFNYLGQFQTNSSILSGIATGDWVAPSNKRDLAIDINGLVGKDGCLSFEIKSRLPDSTVAKRFTDKFQEMLEKIIIFTKDKRSTPTLTPSDFNNNIADLSVASLKSLQAKHGEIEYIFPASGLQQGFVFHALTQPNDDAYRVQCLLHYKFALDLERYKQAWQQASIRFPILRACFEWQHGGKEAVIEIITTKPSIADVNFTMVEDLQTSLRMDRQKPFQLDRPGLIRFLIHREEAGSVKVCVSMHHAIIDGWSVPQLLGWVHDAYDASHFSGEVEVETAFSLAEGYRFANRTISRSFWNDHTKFLVVNDIRGLAGTSQDLALIKHVKQPHQIELSMDITSLKKICGAHEVTVNSAIQFAWHKLLRTYSNDDVTVVGTTVSGRDIPVPGIEKSVGLYINTLPLWFEWKSKTSIVDCMKTMQQRIGLINENCDISLNTLQENGERLFHSLLVFENYPVDSSQYDPKLSIKAHFQLEDFIEKVDYPLCLLGFEKGNTLVLHLKFDASVTSVDDAETVLTMMENILTHIADKPTDVHESISLSPETETTGTTMDIMESSLKEAFETQVKMTPNNVAIVSEDGATVLTYKQLNEKVNKVAHQIGTSPNGIVATYLQGIELIIAILAIIKSGAAYVPISMTYPKEQCEFLLEDSGANLILCASTEDVLTLRLWSSSASIMNVLESENEIADDPDTSCNSDDLAYICYTSGSTGKPKGCLVEHKNVLSLAKATDYVTIGPDDVMVQLSNPSFDAATFEIWSCLLNGARLVVPDKTRKVQSLEVMEDIFLGHGVTVAFVTKTLFDTLFLENANLFSKLKTLLVGGEALNAQIMKSLVSSAMRPERILNAYGPTECTTFATSFEIHANNFDMQSGVPIGSGLAGREPIIMTKDFQRAPVGAIGELYIGGLGTARGYLNRPDLTAERFIEFRGKYGKLYKTGDICRYRHDGAIEYIGRNDSQVKIRGFRIELDGIASTLSMDPLVKQAAVVDHRKGGNHFLVAYVVLHPSTEQDDDAIISEIKENLAAQLPEFMIPTCFMVVANSLPFNNNGKLDRRALPEPNSGGDGNEVVAPRNELEKSLCEIWQQVLHVKVVGVHQDWFQCGGDSISAIRFSGQCQRVLNISLPISLIFEEKTIANMAKHIASSSSSLITRICEHDPNGTVVSSAQERLLFIERLDHDNAAYHVPVLMKLDLDVVDIAQFHRSVIQMAKRHTILNKCFRDGNEGWELADVECPVHVHVVRDVASYEELNDLIDMEIRRSFDLAEEAPMRVTRYESSQHRYSYVLFVWHHLVFDGWSMDLYFQELANMYNGLRLDPLQISYSDYAAWEKANIASLMEQHQGFWKEKLATFEPLSLTTDFQRPKHVDYHGADFKFVLDKSLSGKLRKLAMEQETTLFSVLLTGFYVLLGSLSRQSNVIVGTPTANRSLMETQNLVGFFVNSLPLRFDINPEEQIGQMIRKVHDLVTSAKEHEQLPFEKLVELMHVERDSSRHPIFQIMFGVQKFGEVQENGSIAGAEILAGHETIRGYAPSKFDLSLFMNDGLEEITGIFTYATGLFKLETIERMSEQYVHALILICADSSALVRNVDLLSNKEKDMIQNKWNNTDLRFPDENKTLHELFEEQVDRTPDNIALMFPNPSTNEIDQLTYAELDRQANSLAFRIVQATSATKTYVALYLDRSLEMVISILAVLKAGCAYVPIAPEYPKDRVEFMLQDTNAPVIITQTHYMELFQGRAGVTVLNSEEKSFSKPSLTVSTVECGPDDIAYALYTSGSTGKPKGVLVPHKGVVNRIDWMQREYPLHERDRVLQKTLYTFDVSVWELLWANWVGATIVMAPPESHKDPVEIRKIIERMHVTTLHFVPSMLNIFCQSLIQNNRFIPESIDRIFCSGEALTRISVNMVNDLVTRESQELINLYGPTEASIDVSYFDCKDLPPNNTSVPIGKPIQNIKLFVLDEYLRMVPIGARGELYIAGVGLATGYLNRPELTMDRFIFHHELGRLYKTGDVARWRGDGNLEYLGRNDDQIKIRGQRVELGEIQDQIEHLPDILHAVVVARNHGENDKQLAAYLVLKDGENKKEKARMFRKKLSETLPEHMIPTTFTFVREIPISPTGKVDRQRLPEPEMDYGDDDSEMVAPRTDLEKQLHHIWSTILSSNRISILDNFFQIGGTSLDAVRMAGRIMMELGHEVSVKAIFEKQTIENLAQMIQSQQPEIQYSTIEKHQETGNKFSLSSAQQRMLFLEQAAKGAYNIPLLLELQGQTDLVRLESAINQVLEKHRVLRNVFEIKNGLYQIENGEPLRIISLRSREELVASWSLKFDLTKEKPIKVYHVDGLLSIVFHHISFDGFSAPLFLRDLHQAYSHGHLETDGRIQYTDFAAWERDLDLATEEQYWIDSLTGCENLQLATDFPRPKQIQYDGGLTKFELELELSKKLRMMARSQNTTLFTVLLSAFFVLMRKLASQDDLVIGVPTANRDHPQTQDLIGLFVNTLAIRNKMTGNESPKQLVDAIHGALVEGRKHQQLPFERVVELLGLKRDTTRHLVFQITCGIETEDSSNPYGDLFKVLSNDVLGNYSPAKFDLSLTFQEREGEPIMGMFNFAKSLFEDITIERLCDQYIRILEQFVSKKTYISNIDILPKEHRHLVLESWNETDKPLDYGQTIVSMFEQQVRKTPHHVAVMYDDEIMTYENLNKRANKLAHLLRQRVEIASDSIIALFVDRGIDMVTSMIGASKTGGAYLPISTEFPAARIAAILEEADVKVFVTQDQHLSRVAEWSHIPVVTLEEINSNQEIPSDNFEKPLATGNDLAYIIFTSGTSGRPKGVMIEHRNVVHFMNVVTGLFDIHSLKNGLSFSAYVFDAHVLEVYPVLLSGLTLVIAGEKERHDPMALGHLLVEREVEVALFPPALVTSLKDEHLESLKYVTLGGEAPSVEALDKCLRHGIVFNGYGPSEITVASNFHRYIAGDKAKDIGGTVSNTKLYVLDDNLQPCGLGVPGELYIAGAGVGRGYLNREDLTKERFLPNPFVPEDCTKYGIMYKTGDLVRWTSKDHMEYLGRNDSQVQRNGFRVELGEIEYAINQYIPGVKQNVVVLDSTSHNLVSYMVMEENDDKQSSTMKEMRDILVNKSSLPNYMIPDSFMEIAKIPLTINGKTDLKALPKPIFEEFHDERPFVAPRNDVELALSKLWGNVLGLEEDHMDVGIKTNFFEIGGNSISAMRLAAAMSTTFQRDDISVAVLFEHGTIEQLAELIMGSERGIEEHKAIVKSPMGDESPLSFAQERLLFIEKFQENNAYNIPFLVRLNQGISVERIVAALAKVARKHAVLNTLFKEKGDGTVAQTVVDQEWSNHRHERCGSLDGFIASTCSLPFDLAKEVPMRAHFLLDHGENSYLMLVWHHIAFDGWSLSIFLEDFEAAYANTLEIDEVSSIQYSDYAVWEREQLCGEKLKKLVEFWDDSLNGYENLQLPTDFPRPKTIDYTGKTLAFELEEQLAAKLKKLAVERQTTLYTVMLSGFYILLGHLTGQRDLVIGTPAANRVNHQAQSLIGFFVNSLALRAQLALDKESFGGFIDRIKELNKKAQAHQSLPFEKLVDALDIERDQSRHPVFQAMFSLQNFSQQQQQQLQQSSSVFDQVVALDDSYAPAKFDLSLFIEQGDDAQGITGYLNYACALFARETAQRFVDQYVYILDKLAEEPDVTLMDVELLTPEEKDILLNHWSGCKEYEEEREGLEISVIEAFQQQVQLCPDAIAVSTEDGLVQLTYKQLDERAEELAQQIRDDFGEQEYIAVYSQGVELIVSTLAILKANAAYVPLSTSYPFHQVEYILQDTQASMILTTPKLADSTLQSWNLSQNLIKLQI